MALPFLALCCLAAAAAAADPSCSAGSETSCDNTPKSEGGRQLLQRKSEAEKTTVQSDVVMEGRLANPLLTYYQRWSAGAVSRQLENRSLARAAALDQAGAAAHGQAATVAGLAERMRRHREERCPLAAAQTQASWGLVDSAIDAAGVRHTLLVSRSGRPQYVAERDGAILASDPVLCPRYVPVFIEGSRGPGGSGGKTVDMSLEPLSADGTPTLLNKEDQAVKDAVELFNNVTKENCGGKAFQSVEVVTAEEQVIDGLSIILLLSVSGKRHYVRCEFEVSGDHKDASLLALGGRDAGAHKPFDGAVGKIVMDDFNICDCEKRSSLASDAAAPAELLHRGMGELSRYKGFEHVNDDLPRLAGISMLSTEALPSSYSQKAQFPACFPDLGREVMRNQGDCGSCWAFASASATMNNLCASDASQSLHTSSDRYEVSVQNLLSCNSGQRGCKGGSATHSNDAFATAGIAKERDHPYQCGGGDPQNHFDSATSCKAYPWGGTCRQSIAVADWQWFGAAIVSGEADMMTVIATGNSLYASFDVYENFMNVGPGDGVVTTVIGAKKGGHAVTAIGFGVESGIKYWLIQNSWGTGWGDHGYAKMKRGSNFCGIETNAYYLRAWVSGGTVPPCFDGSTTGLSGSRGPIPCSQATGSIYGDLCAGWPSVKSNCPVTCGMCQGQSLSGAPPPGSSTPHGTPAPTPAPATAAGCIADETSKFPGNPCVFKNGCSYEVLWKCPTLPCTHSTQGNSGYLVSSCNGQAQTEICQGVCNVWRA